MAKHCQIYTKIIKDICTQYNLPFIQSHTYRNIFNNDFNISFFVPKKDQCDQCTAYKLTEESKREELNEPHIRHLQEKERCREEKVKDKALINDTFIVACYDLLSVMTVPNGEISTFYYASKLNCLNFTRAELGVDHTECYFWDIYKRSQNLPSLTYMLSFTQIIAVISKKLVHLCR